MSDESRFYDENSRLARIAWMYYVQGLTQEEIGKRLRYSRTKVTRLLGRAREEGIVEIRINSRYSAGLEAEEYLRSRFALEQVIVVPAGGGPDADKSGVGLACANYLESVLEPGDTLGCAWGRSLFHVGRLLRPQRPRDLTVVQLIGGLNAGENINPQKIMELILAKLQARGVWLNTPAVVATASIREALVQDPGVGAALETARGCDKALVGIGDTTDQAVVVAAGSISPEEMGRLRELGAVGDILSQHFDIRGRPVRSEILDRVISLSLEDLKRIPVRIGSASGAEKAAPVLGALRGGYINVLVTDESTAAGVIELDKRG